MAAAIFLLPGFRHQCDEVRHNYSQEGRRQGSACGWDARFYCSTLNKQNNPAQHAPTVCPLHNNIPITQNSRRYHSVVPTRGPSPSLSLSLPCSGLYPVSPRQLLKSNTGVRYLHLTHLRLALLPRLSPVTDSAKPRPPRHIPPPPDSGRGAIRPAASPPLLLERKSATVICTPGLWIT